MSNSDSGDSLGGTVDSVDGLDSVDSVDSLDSIDSVDSVDSVDGLDSVDSVDSVDTAETDDGGDTGMDDSDLGNCSQEGATRDVACGLNGRGAQRQYCEDGNWKSQQCVDPDGCKDGDTQSDTCGILGSRTDTCVEGHWETGICEDPHDNPGDAIPEESKGKFLYFSAKKLDDKYNSNLYMLDMTAETPALVQLTDTSDIDETSPSSPLTNNFLVYEDGDGSDIQYSDLRFVSLGEGGRPIKATDKQLIPTEREECMFSAYKLGKGNPAVSLDGTEFVFVSTYVHDTDFEGCPLLAYRLSRATIDAGGNPGPIEDLAWDSGVEPGVRVSKPMSPIYLKDTKRVAVSVFGLDQHPLSTEIQICSEPCSSIGDWDWLTFHAIWSSGNVAQRCLAPNPVSDEVAFFRQFPGTEFESGIYTAGDISTAGGHPIYGDYGVLDTTETLISNLAGAEHISYAQRPLAVSPDGALIAVAITFVTNDLLDERYSEIGILDKASGKLLAIFDFDQEVRDIDGLLWR